MVIRNSVLKLTKAQANADITKKENNKLSLEAFGASTHFISDVFNFSDEFFDEDPSDRALLIDQQKTDSTLHTIRQLQKDRKEVVVSSIEF